MTSGTANPPPSTRGSAWLAPAVAAAIALAAFATTARAGFVWDDAAFFPLPPKLTGASPLAFFRHGAWAYAAVGRDSDIYRPVVLLVLWAIGPVLGNAPLPWHALSVGLHAAASVLVYLLARRSPFSAPRFAAMCGAIAFAAHPVHVEAVAWVMAFVHPLATCLALLAALAQLAHARTGRAGALAAALAATGAAMLTSEGAFAVPAMVLALEAAERRAWPPLRAFAGHALVVALAFGLRAAALGPSLPVQINRVGIARMASFTAAYARNLVLPWPQRVFGAPPEGTVAGVVDWAAAAVVFACAAVAIRRVRRPGGAAPAAAAGWVVLPLAPLAAGALSGLPLFAPRALYLPSVGVALLVAWAVRHVRSGPAPAWALAAASCAGIVACNLACAPWANDLALHEEMLLATPDASPVHASLAAMYQARGDRDRAERHWLGAAEHAEGEERRRAREGLAVLYGESGRLDEAERLLLMVVAEDPLRASAWVNLGNVAYSRGHLEEAAASYARALRIDPSNREAALNVRILESARP